MPKFSIKIYNNYEKLLQVTRRMHYLAKNSTFIVRYASRCLLHKPHRPNNKTKWRFSKTLALSNNLIFLLVQPVDAKLKAEYLTTRTNEFPANEQRPALFPAENTEAKSVDWDATFEPQSNGWRSIVRVEKWKIWLDCAIMKTMRIEESEVECCGGGEWDWAVVFLLFVERHGSKQCEFHAWHVNASLGIATRTWRWSSVRCCIIGTCVLFRVKYLTHHTPLTAKCRSSTFSVWTAQNAVVSNGS